MLEVTAVEPLEGRTVRLTLSDGTVVERDLTDLIRGGVFEPIAADDATFRRVSVDYGTCVWPDALDIAPETLIWDGARSDGPVCLAAPSRDQGRSYIRWSASCIIRPWNVRRFR